MKFCHLSVALAATLSIASPLLAQSAPMVQVHIASQSLSSDTLGEFSKQTETSTHC